MMGGVTGNRSLLDPGRSCHHLRNLFAVQFIPSLRRRPAGPALAAITPPSPGLRG